MSAVIAMKGRDVEMSIDGKIQKVTPFVGADHAGQFSSMGIGYLLSDQKGCLIWGLVIPHALIRSWRGMKLLENMTRIEHGTLCACWTVCGHNLSDSDQGRKEELAQQFESREAFDVVLEEILISVPSSGDLEVMIKTLLSNDVSVDGWDLKAEVDANRMKMTEQIQGICDAEEANSLAYKKEQEECNRKISRAESLSAFFVDLDIDYFIIGGGFGGYGMDWGHIEREDLDRIAREESFSEHLPKGHKLERTTMSPKTKVMGIGSEIKMYETSFGDIEQPYHTTNDGTKYTFVYAKWIDGKFYIRTLVEQGETIVSPEVTEFTIAQLRKLLDVKEHRSFIFVKSPMKRVWNAIFG